MSEIGELLRNLRGKDSLRTAAMKTGLSHSYISAVELGKHPKSKVPVRPSPDTLMAYSKAYLYSYEALMKVAGYYFENNAHNDELAIIVAKISKLPEHKRKVILDLIDVMCE